MDVNEICTTVDVRPSSNSNSPILWTSLDKDMSVEYQPAIAYFNKTLTNPRRCISINLKTYILLSKVIENKNSLNFFFRKISNEVDLTSIHHILHGDYVFDKKSFENDIDECVHTSCMRTVYRTSTTDARYTKFDTYDKFKADVIKPSIQFSEDIPQIIKDFVDHIPNYNTEAKDILKWSIKRI